MVDRSSRQTLWGFDYIPIKNEEFTHRNQGENALGMLIQQNSLGDVFAQMITHNREKEKKNIDSGDIIYDEKSPTQPVVPPKIVRGGRETLSNREDGRKDREKQIEQEDGGVDTSSSSRKNINKDENRGNNSNEPSESEIVVYENSSSEISGGKLAKKSDEVTSHDSENSDSDSDSDSDDSSDKSDSSDTTGSSGEEESLDQEEEEEEEEEEGSSDSDDNDDDDDNIIIEKRAAHEIQECLAENDKTADEVEGRVRDEETEDEANRIQDSLMIGIEEEEDDEQEDKEDYEAEEVVSSTELNVENQSRENQRVVNRLTNESVQEATDEDTEDEGQDSKTANKNHPRFSLRDVISEKSFEAPKVSFSPMISENAMAEVEIEVEVEARVVNSSSSREGSSEGRGCSVKEKKSRGSLYRSLPKTTIHLG